MSSAKAMEDMDLKELIEEGLRVVQDLRVDLAKLSPTPPPPKSPEPDCPVCYSGEVPASTPPSSTPAHPK